MPTVADLRALFVSIPTEFWAAIFGALFPLAGVFATNKSGDRRLRSQLDHQRQLQKDDRELALRKEVYMAAAEAISAGLIGIAKLSNIEIPIISSANQFEEKAPAIAKIQIVGAENTLKAVTQLTSAMGAAFAELVTARIPLDVDRQRVDSLNQIIAQCQRTIDQMLERMRQFNLEEQRDQGQWNAIQKQYDFQQELMGTYLNEKAEIYAKIAIAQSDLALRCTAKNAELSLLTVPVLVAIRIELGLPIDEETLRNIMSGAHKEAREAVENVVRGIEEMLNPADVQVAAN